MRCADERPCKQNNILQSFKERTDERRGDDVVGVEEGRILAGEERAELLNSRKDVCRKDARHEEIAVSITNFVTTHNFVS